MPKISTPSASPRRQILADVKSGVMNFLNTCAAPMLWCCQTTTPRGASTPIWSLRRCAAWRGASACSTSARFGASAPRRVMSQRGLPAVAPPRSLAPSSQRCRMCWRCRHQSKTNAPTCWSRYSSSTRRFVAYPSDAAHVAHALWITHTHLMAAWESTPRLAFLSPEPASGKTRALEITELLVPNAVEAINVTPAYLFRKVGDDEAKPTILYDEIDTVFGPKAKENEEIRGLLNAGHRRGAVAGRCVVKGKNVTTEEILTAAHSSNPKLDRRALAIYRRYSKPALGPAAW